MDQTTEQIEQPQQPAEPAEGGIATRDELIAAVREAGGTASVDLAAEEQAAKDQAAGAEQAPTAEQAPPAGEEEPRIDRILREREKAHQERHAARSHAE